VAIVIQRIADRHRIAERIRREPRRSQLTPDYFIDLREKPRFQGPKMSPWLAWVAHDPRPSSRRLLAAVGIDCSDCHDRDLPQRCYHLNPTQERRVFSNPGLVRRLLALVAFPCFRTHSIDELVDRKIPNFHSNHPIVKIGHVVGDRLLVLLQSTVVLRQRSGLS
jgi:hypothetical protein